MMNYCVKVHLVSYTLLKEEEKYKKCSGQIFIDFKQQSGKSN